MPVKRKGKYLTRPARTCLLCTLTWIILLGAACQPQSEPVRGESSHVGGSLWIGVEEEIHGFDVLRTGGSMVPATAIAGNLILEPLFRRKADGELIPVLGLSATPAENAKIWTVVLRSDVRFHDGTPFNADAVVQHWQRLLDPDSNFRGRIYIEPILRVEKIDALTVRFELTHTWQPFLAVLSNPLNLIAFIPSPKSVAEGLQHSQPVGTGPFRYIKIKDEGHTLLVKNQRYWKKGRPLVDELVLTTVPDHQTRYASLKSGALDGILMDRGNLIRKAAEDETLVTYQTAAGGAEIILVNTAVPPLDDIRVRRALAYANNQMLHIKMVYKETLPFVKTPFGDQIECANSGYLAHDLDKARALIADYGKPVSLKLLHTNTPRGRNIGELTQQLYKAIGVDIVPVGLSTPPHVMKVLSGDYQISTWRILGQQDYGPFLFTFLHSQGTRNFSNYRNSQMDELLQAQRLEADVEQRDQLHCEIARLMNEQVPFLYRGGRRYHLLASKNLMGIPHIRESIIPLTDAWIAGPKRSPFAEIARIDKSATLDQDIVLGPAYEQMAGTWKGNDSMQGTLKFVFKPNGTLVAIRKGGRDPSPQKGKYAIESGKIEGRMGEITFNGTLSQDQVKGVWQMARRGVSAQFQIKRQ